MLTKFEDKIMNAIYCSCKGKSGCLLTPDDILSLSGVRGSVNYEKLDKILDSLELDDYFDIIISDRKGEKVYCITLHEKGQGYTRQKTIIKRNLGFKLIITVIFALISFAVTFVLKAIF